MNKILVFSADPGGAECLVPVVGALPESIDVMVMGKNTACQVFEKNFNSFLRVNDMKFDDIQTTLNNYSIDAILTSASSLPERDMTEKLLWKWALSKHVPSVAVLDQWQAYARRFSGCDPSERLAYLPDKIAIMDELAKKEMLEEGFPEDRLCVTGQPSLENFEKSISDIRRNSRAGRIRNNDDDVILTFFSQPVKAFFGDTVGYDENKVLNDIVSIIPTLKMRWGKEITLLCKLHPKERLEDCRLSDQDKGANLKFIKDEYSNQELIVQSNLVIGMGSVVMVHSTLSGIPTVSYEPGRKSNVNACMPAKIGAISSVTNKNDLVNIIDRLLADKDFLKGYLEKQKLCKTHKGAADNIIALLKNMLDKK